MPTGAYSTLYLEKDLSAEATLVATPLMAQGRVEAQGASRKRRGALRRCLILFPTMGLVVAINGERFVCRRDPDPPSSPTLSQGTRFFGYQVGRGAGLGLAAARPVVRARRGVRSDLRQRALDGGRALCLQRGVVCLTKSLVIYTWRHVHLRDRKPSSAPLFLASLTRVCLSSGFWAPPSRTRRSRDELSSSSARFMIASSCAPDKW